MGGKEQTGWLQSKSKLSFFQNRFKQLKDARARRSGHHQSKQQVKKSKIPAVNNKAIADMPTTPAYMQDPFNQTRKEKHGLWKGLVGFITCTGEH